jgi:signal transduction histidine kinase
MILCAVGIAVFLNFYFSAFQNPYMQGHIFDLSDDWQYETPHTGLTALDSLRSGPKLSGGETLTLYKNLDVSLSDAAVLIRANHQSANVYIGGTALLLEPYEPGDNPGMALHILRLPDDYLGKTLKIELTSPYAPYSGRTSPILLGTVPSLEMYTQVSALRPLVTLLVCLAILIPVAVVSFIQMPDPVIRWRQLAIGAASLIWAMYYVCSEYDILMFLTPASRSNFTLGLYYLIALPLSLFLYLSFEFCKKQMFPVVMINCAFTAAAFVLQFSGLVDFPRLLVVCDVLWLCWLYPVILTVIEDVKKNKSMVLASPALSAAYIFLVYRFYAFYERRAEASNSHRDVYFLLVLVILVYTVWLFFKDIYRRKQETEVISLQKRMAQDGYERVQAHLKEVSGLKHDIKSHLTALSMYLEHGRADEAREYLSRYAEQAAAVTETAFSEHFLINAIAGTLSERAREQGIKTELKLKAAPKHIAHPALYGLLSNLTDNALEACSAMPEGSDKFIKLSVTKRDPYFVICISNSKSGETVTANGKIRTTKTENGHGYGLWTVERIVNAYDGMINIEHDENTFTVSAALKDRPTR